MSTGLITTLIERWRRREHRRRRRAAAEVYRDVARGGHFTRGEGVEDERPLTRDRR